MVKYLRDWATSKERADLVAELDKPHDPLDDWHPDWDVSPEALGEMLRSRNKTKH